MQYLDKTGLTYFWSKVKDKIPTDKVNEIDNIVNGDYDVNDFGTNLTLKTIEANIINYSIKGDTQQNGTPTPSAPIPVETVTGGQVVTVCGKNLFDKDNIISGYRLDGSGNPSSSANNEFTSDFIPVESGATYIRSYGNINAYTRTCFYNKNKSFVSKNDDSQSFTIPSNVKYIRFSEYLTRLDTMQLEKGSTATTYEPYKGASYPINLGDIELCKLGDYQDRIYKDNGKWYIEKQIGKVVLDGTQNITLAGSGVRRFNATYTTLGLTNIKDGTGSYDSANYRMCDHFTHMDANHNSQLWGIYYLYNNWLVMFDTESVIADANVLKTWFQSNNTNIYYVLATPTTTEITDTELIAQLNALDNANTYDRITNIIVNGKLSSILDITTYSNTIDGREIYLDNKKQDKLISGTNIKTINNNSLLGSGNITISSGTSTDVQVNGTSITSSGIANLQTEGAYSSNNKLTTKNYVNDNYVPFEIEDEEIGRLFMSPAIISHTGQGVEYYIQADSYLDPDLSANFAFGLEYNEDNNISTGYLRVETNSGMIIIDENGTKITNVITPTNNRDVVNKAYVDTIVGDIETLLGGI